MVKPGFKHNKVGVIPEDWEVKKLGEVVRRQVGGGTPSRSLADYWTGQIPWVTVKDFATFNPSDSQEHISNTGLENSASNLIKAGTLITSTRMAIGKTVIYAVDVAINQDLKALYLNANFSTQFFYYWFQANELKIFNLGSGSTVKGISIGQLLSLEAWSPPTLHEQNLIATALSDTDNLIDSLERLIEKKRQIKQGAMQTLLTGKIRLPGFSGDWVEKRLGEVAEVHMGQSPPSACYNTNEMGIPLIQGNADVNNRRSVSRIFTTCFPKVAPENSIIMSVRAPVGHIAISHSKICLGRGVCSLVSSEPLLYHCLVSLENKWLRLSKGSTFDSITSSDVKAFPIPLPPTLKEQEAISQVLTSMDDDIEKLEARLAKTKSIKQGMMQELLTGRIRLI
jgi:type I restriction enzyme S subunit